MDQGAPPQEAARLSQNDKSQVTANENGHKPTVNEPKKASPLKAVQTASVPTIVQFTEASLKDGTQQNEGKKPK